MESQKTKQGIIVDDYLIIWIESFLRDRRAQNMSPGTLEFYRKKLAAYTEYAGGVLITRIGQITPDSIRDYLLRLADNGHNPGGIHACYRALKTFLRWYWDEIEPDFKNPIAKVKPPRLENEPLEPVTETEVRTLLSVCDSNFTGLRDRALILTLLDTGSRAAEILSMNRADFDQATGCILIRQGKGRKPRFVYVDKRSRRAIRRYVIQRQDTDPALWITEYGGRLTYWGLREIIRRRAESSGIDPPTLHSFRRAFALNSLRAGMDIYTLQRLMGHADLQVLRRYLKQTEMDLQSAHEKASLVELWEL